MFLVYAIMAITKEEVFFNSSELGVLNMKKDIRR